MRKRDRVVASAKTAAVRDDLHIMGQQQSEGRTGGSPSKVDVERYA
jgi:hypothetical protein